MRVTPMSRRSFVGRVAGGVAAAGGALALLQGRAGADPPGTPHPHGLMDGDADTADPGGLGRNQGGADQNDPINHPPTSRPRTRPIPLRPGCNDADPADPTGAGQRCPVVTPRTLVDDDAADPHVRVR